MKKDNYKYLIGLIIGVVISMVGAYASTKYDANVIYNNPAGSTLSSTNVQDAIDELVEKYKTVFKDCPSNLICKRAGASDYTALTLGDYINYTSPTTSFTTDTSYTGCNSSSNSSVGCIPNQTINPSELTSWRVISKNEDGTVDIVSEYVSSTDVYFYGKTGYKNLVLGLRTIANAYKDDGTLISSARPFGYSNQADTCTDFTSSSSTCRNDEGYQTDFNLVNTVLETTVANKVGTTSAASYLLPSRNFSSGSYINCEGRYVGSLGSVGKSMLYYAGNCVYGYNECSLSASLRIILTLKSGIGYISAGENTWDISA